MLWLAAHPLVLASRSAICRSLLESAGIPVDVVIADLDERAIEARAGSVGASEAAVLLASAKARAVAPAFADQLVLGADQTLALGDQRFTKPADVAAARAQLQALSGCTHELYQALRWCATVK